MVAENFNVGATIEYACDEGHLLVGPTARICLDTGFYNEFPPVCKRIQCGYPADIANGEYTLVNDSVGYLSRVIYTCDEGYEMIGRAQLACDIDERWNGPPPRCERKFLFGAILETLLYIPLCFSQLWSVRHQRKFRTVLSK